MNTPPERNHPLRPACGLHARFLRVLARIERHGRVRFRHRDPNSREDLIAETVGLCWAWFVRLRKQNKDPIRFVSALAAYAARRVHAGRCLGGTESTTDAL